MGLCLYALFSEYMYLEAGMGPKYPSPREASDFAPPVRRSLDEGGSFDGQAGQAKC